MVSKLKKVSFSLSDQPPRKTRQSGRPKLSDDRNLPEVILECAIKLFAERGPENVTIKDIAENAGVATSLVHHHFGKRSDLRSACCDHVLSTLQLFIENLEDELPDVVSPSDLDRLGDALIQSFRHRIYYLRFLALLFFESDANANKVFKKYFDILHKLTQRYVQAGLLRDGLDPRWVTTQLIYSQLGTVFLMGPLTEVIGQDIYSLENSSVRTRTFIEIAKRGLFNFGEEHPDSGMAED